MNPPSTRTQLVVRFALLSAAMGLALGLVEAAMLYYTPRVPTLHESEMGWVVWPLATLLDFGLFTLLGAILGCSAAALRRPSPLQVAVVVAVLMGLVGAFLAWSVSLVHIWAGDLDALQELTAPAAGFGLGFLTTAYVLRLTWLRSRIVFDPSTSWPVRGAAKAIGAVVVSMTLALAWFALSSPSARAVRADDSGAPGRPNIILIVLDTVRADHLSSYGYSRSTTPHLDRLAQQGVLFENAIAPSSWTLPSHASLFTGLLPHQHGASTYSPLHGQPRTLAEILRASGYETANFFANGFGVRAWGLAQGFETQDDLRSFLPHNLGSTFVGRVIVQPLWMTVSRPDSYFRRRAPSINSAALRWSARRSQRPFFLFINYLDAHDPHVAPHPHDDHFGEILPNVVRRVSFGNGAPIEPPLTEQEQASAVNGYDNCLSFLDDQVGKLLAGLSAAPDWKNTIVIVTSDHGEAFGEHGLYLHNRSLYFREAIHVPLIVTGPGVPAGFRVPYVVPIREIFSTVLDYTMANPAPFQSASLRRFWTPGFRVDPEQNHAVSELIPFLPNFRPVMISLMVEDWHYIRKSDSTAELYHWRSDPMEKLDLAKSPEHQQVMKTLDDRLKALAGSSTPPWREPEYLLALDDHGSSFAHDILQRDGPIPFGAVARRIGTSQAFFNPDQSSHSLRPAGADDEDLIRSLPYR